MALRKLPSVADVPVPDNLLQPLSASRRAMTVQAAISGHGTRRSGLRGVKWVVLGGRRPKWER